MDGQTSDLAAKQGDSDSDTNEDLAEEAAAADCELSRRLFNDTVSQSKLDNECCDNKSDFTADSEHSFDVDSGDVTAEALRFIRSGVHESPEAVDDADLFSGPDEWRDIWEWEVGKCNRMIADQNTQQYDEAENCTDSDESVKDGDSESDGNIKEYPFMLCRPAGTWTFADSSDQTTNVVSSSVLVNEPVFCSTGTQFDYTDYANTDAAACGRVLSDSDAIRSVLDEVVTSCIDDEVMWDSTDESGLTELDRQRDIRPDRPMQFSQNLTSNSLEGRALSMRIPTASSSSYEHQEFQDRISAENSRSENGFMSGYAASSLFAQRSTYGSGSLGRQIDSMWNAPRTPPNADDDGCRWKPRKSWRKNSADGLDSAGCSPKDEEDDDSDIETAENCGAAASLKPNKISPAAGYHAGSSYYIPIAKQKSWLARCDDREPLPSSESNNLGFTDPSDNSFYNRYSQLRRSDDGAPAGRGFTPSSDAVMERMMRRKEARRQRERANMTESDSVAGYRGGDYSIDELIEYIDAKPPSTSKSERHKRTSNRKSRKKKHSSNRPAKSTGDVSSATPVSSSCIEGDTILDKTSPENFAAEPTVDTDSDVRTTDERVTSQSLGDDDKVDLASEPMSELPLCSDTFFQMQPVEGSSSNTSDADNASDSRTDGALGNYAEFFDRCRESVDMPFPRTGSQACDIDENLSVKLDSEPITVPGAQSTETVTSVEVDEFVTAALSNCCLEQSSSTVSDKGSTRDSVQCDKSTSIDTDTNSPGAEMIALRNTENCSPSVSSSSIVFTTDSIAVDSIRGMQRRHSDVLAGTAVFQAVAGQSSESVHGMQNVPSTDAGQSTPSSSISDARDFRDFDFQSLADDMLLDFHFSAPTSHESDFTVVTRRTKKRQSRSNAGAAAAGCLRRTFYNRNRLDTGLAIRDWQNHCRNESVVRDSAIVPTTVNVTHSAASGNLELHSLTVSQLSTSRIPLEVSVGTEYSCTESDTNIVTDTVLESTLSALSYSKNTFSQNATKSTAVHSCKTSQTLSSIDRRTQENVFLDTRRPNAGATPSAAFSELSFWYDVNIPENQSSLVQTNTAMLSPAFSIREPGVNVEDSSIANFSTYSVAAGLASSLTCTVSADTHLHSCAYPVVAAGDSISLTVDLNSYPLTVPAHGVNNYPQSSVQSPLLSHIPACYVTSTSSSTSDTVNNSVGHSVGDVIRPVVSSTVSEQSPADINVSATDSVRHSTDRDGRQLFDLEAAQLFLYTEFQRVLSTRSQNPEDVHFATADSNRS